MIDNNVTNPQERRKKGRRKKLTGIWSTKEWKEQKAAFLNKNPWCVMHLQFRNDDGMHPAVPATIPHHPYKTSYKDGYSDLELSQCVAYCTRCHFAVHHGMKLCEVCGEHYHPWDAPMCKRCFDKAHPEIVKKREEAKAEYERVAKEKKDAKNLKLRAAKKKHPCKFNRLGGKCGKSIIGSRCSYSPRKAVNCDGYTAKGAAQG